jgi:4-amino-4-deoxy-L-arabinose transferase-like glycosyltransferase
MTVFEQALLFLRASLWFGLSVLAFSGWGYRIMGSMFEKRWENFALAEIFSIALGAFALSLWVWVCGFFGVLNYGWVLAFFILGWIAWIIKRNQQLYNGSHFFKDLRAGTPSSNIFYLILLPVIVLTGLSFAGAQAPAIGNDTLSYHLYFPRLHVEAGRLVHDASHARSLWPAMMGMLYSAGLLLEGVTLAKLYSWMTALLGVLAVPAACLYFFKSASRAGVACLLMAGLPVIWMQSLYAYVDNAIMLYFFLSFVALYAWREGDYSVRKGVIAGLFLAALLSIKIVTLIPFVILCLIFGVLAVKDAISKKRRLLNYGVPILVGLLFSSIWFLRSWVLAGNPVFPFLSDLFGGHGFSQRMVGFALIPKTFLNLILLPWNLTHRVDIYGGEPLGCLFLVLLPLLFRRHPRILQTAIFFVVIFTTAWYYSSQHIRFLFPIFPMLAFIYADPLCNYLSIKSPLRKITLGFLAFLIGIHIVLGMYYSIKMLPPVLGLVSRYDYLLNKERSFVFMQSIKGFIEEGDKILFVGEPRLYYSPAPAVYMNQALFYEVKKRGRTLEQWLRENKITHVLRRDEKPVDLSNSDFDFKGTTIHIPLTPLISVSHSEDGVSMHYSFWRIKPLT